MQSVPAGGSPDAGRPSSASESLPGDVADESGSRASQCSIVPNGIPLLASDTCLLR